MRMKKVLSKIQIFKKKILNKPLTKKMENGLLKNRKNLQKLYNFMAITGSKFLNMLEQEQVFKQDLMLKNISIKS